MGPVPHPALREDVELGNGSQVDAQEVEIDTRQGGLADAGDGGFQFFYKLRNGLGRDNLVIIAVAGEHGRSGILDNGHNLLSHIGRLHQNIGDGLTYHSQQGPQDQQGNQAPQAAAAHGSALIPVELLNQFVLLLGIIGIPGLNFLNPGGQAGHLHHALLALGINGQKHHLNQNGKQDHGNAVVAGQLIQEAQQIAKGNGDDVG